ncbi:MAG: hypothetical protein ABIH83_04930 [Candidatus Micrarchaeota archaeon]
MIKILREDYAKNVYEKTNGKPGPVKRFFLRLNHEYNEDIYAKMMLFDFNYHKATEFRKKDMHKDAVKYAKKALKYDKDGLEYNGSGEYKKSHPRVLDNEHDAKKAELNMIIGEYHLYEGIEARGIFEKYDEKKEPEVYTFPRMAGEGEFMVSITYKTKQDYLKKALEEAGEAKQFFENAAESYDAAGNGVEARRAEWNAEDAKSLAGWAAMQDIILFGKESANAQEL